MAKKRPGKPPPLSVGEFFAKYAEHLELKVEGRATGMKRRIREPTINRPGLALAGFHTYFADKRIQIIGNAELSYLKSLAPKVSQKRIHEFFSRSFPCLVMARNLHIPPAIIQAADEFEIPVFRTPMVTMKFINAATLALETEFAPTTSEYGSMVDIQGVGVLIRGASGIGKSECVLGLIERGYSLVSDDITCLRQVEGRELIAMASELTRFHMEVRGIGIINVAAAFGVGSVRPEKKLDLVVSLREGNEVEEVDRLGLDRDMYEILGISVPHITLPVKMGRDLGRLVEVAALEQKLKGMGQSSAEEFNQRLIQYMQREPK